MLLSGLGDAAFANYTVGTVAPNAGETNKALLVDIDVFKDCELPPDLPTLLDQLREFREIKNDLFFGTVTEKALESYA
jgi:uncharacterized protein (TIGR04255 family)